MDSIRCDCGWKITCFTPMRIKCGKCGVLIQCGSMVDVKPPRWVRLLQRLSKPQDIGLGATVSRIAARFGGERFKGWATKIGLPCGCTEREAHWNKLYPNPSYRQP